MTKTFDEILAIIEEKMQQINWLREPRGLYAPIDYSLHLGGKRLRPALTLMGCNLFADNILPAIAPSIGLEIFHNFTLLHDDIMDCAPVRRGQPTVHLKWNKNTAILSGDQMLIEAYKMVAQAPAEMLQQVLDVFSQTATEVCEGQQYDMEFETADEVSEENYLEMIRLKTAVLLGGALKIGAIIGSAKDIDIQQIYAFGINIGLAFQLKDDWLDVYGDPAVFGKKIGGDILCNKKTFLLINALKHATGNTAENLDMLLNHHNGTSEEKIGAITDIFNRLKIRELTEEKIDFYYRQSLKNLENISVLPEKKQNLEILTKTLLFRNK